MNIRLSTVNIKENGQDKSDGKVENKEPAATPVGVPELYETTQIEVGEQYSVIKRMLVTLDRFLCGKFFSIITFYLLAVTGCAVGLIVNNTSNAQASSGGGSGGSGISTANVWLFSAIGVMTFLFLLVVIYVLTARRKKKPVKKI